MSRDTEGFSQHISQQFNDELEALRTKLLEMGGLVEKQVYDAVTALIEADGKLAEKVRENDHTTNDMERQIEELIAKVGEFV